MSRLRAVRQVMGRRSPAGQPGDAGSGTVLALAVVCVVVVAAAALAALAEADVVRHRGAVVADAAALAAATGVDSGSATACTDAARVAAVLRGTVTSCHVAGAVVDVAVAVRPPPWLSWAGAATGRARAGPATPTPGDPDGGRAIPVISPRPAPAS